MTYLPLVLALVGAAAANPFPQGVTAAIAPPAPAPPGCAPTYSGMFGVSVMNVTTSQGSDGQTTAGNGTPVSQQGDGQAISQIGDGQIQNAISQIGDGQVQNRPAVTQIGDGQVQNKPAASQIGDGQVQTGQAVGQAGDGQTQATGSGAIGASGINMVACQDANTLQLTLNNGILLDSQGRTGYIASNYQFQFDKPAQAGAIYTAGFSVCGNGSLALGGSTQFWQCRSGDFYNLYDRWWAAQCMPVNINIVQLISC